MGDFSKDPKDRLADSIKKRYVGVRMQQGVPILDSDWNEMEDLRKHEVSELFRQFVGSGVPSGNDGFRIMAVSEDNNFAISKGTILVKGRYVINEHDNLTYRNQPDLDPEDIYKFTTPAEDVTYIVYLDTWEIEVDGIQDEDLIDNRIGVETCIRLKREWSVCVKEGETLPEEPEDHRYYPLAEIKRPAENAQVTFHMITDLRRIHLNLAENTKSPLALYDSLGNITYNTDNFSNLLELTEKVYFNLLKSDLFMSNNFVSALPLETATISAVFNEVMQVARVGSIQARIGNLDNRDGLRILETLYYAQDHFISILEELIAADSSKSATSEFLVVLRNYLDGGSGGLPPGLKAAVITGKDLEAGIDAQQEINREIGGSTHIFPHGHLVVKYTSGPPAGTTIEADKTYRFRYDITFERTRPGPPQKETFDLLPALDPRGWGVSLVENTGGTIDLETDETAQVFLDVTIPQDTSVDSSVVKFRVRSRNNPAEMDTTNTEVELKLESSSTQPNPLLIDLILPTINIGEDVLPVGIGFPYGLPGKGVNLKFRFTYLEEVTLPEDFSVIFETIPEDTFIDILPLQFPLGGDEGQSTDKLISGFQATSPDLNGTEGTLIVRMQKDSDPDIFKEIEIALIVQTVS